MVAAPGVEPDYVLPYESGLLPNSPHQQTWWTRLESNQQTMLYQSIDTPLVFWSIGAAGENRTHAFSHTKGVPYLLGHSSMGLGGIIEIPTSTLRMSCSAT